MQGDGVHPARPDQQRIRGIGCALVAVAATLHDEPQIVLAGEIDGRDDIVGRPGGHGVGARLRRPGVDPAERLRQTDFVAEVVGVLQFLEDLRAAGARWRLQARRERRLHLDEPPPDIPAEPVPARLGRPCRVTGADTRHGAGCGRSLRRSEHPGTHSLAATGGAAAAACKKRLLFIFRPWARLNVNTTICRMTLCQRPPLFPA